MSSAKTRVFQHNYKGEQILVFRADQSENQLIDVNHVVSPIYKDRTEFNYLFVYFGEMFSLEKYQPQSEATSTDTFLIKSTEKSFAEISRLANKESAFSPTENLRFLNSFHKIFSSLNEKHDWLSSDKFIVPLKGGGVVTSLFKLPRSQVYAIDSKRLPLSIKKGCFGFGMHIDIELNELENIDVNHMYKGLKGKTVTILEVCVVSGITTCAFLLDLYFQKIQPKRIRIVAAVVSEQGMSCVNDFAKSLGFELEWVTARITNLVGDFYTSVYDVLLNKDRSLILKSPWDAYQRL